MSSELELVSATANAHKAKEIAAILGEDIRLVPRPPEVGDVEENGDTLLDNARLKARAIAEATGRPAIADDSGLEVEALGGAPGVWSARYAGEDATYADNVVKLLGELAALPDGGGARRAAFHTVALVVYPDGSEVRAEGTVAGHITTSARGEAGFGYDSVFVPDEGDGRTFAELEPEEKNAVSARGRAFRALAGKLAAGRTAAGG